jgi:NTP pyrophosphatase (non-canonical NTP hydrolase)
MKLADINAVMTELEHASANFPAMRSEHEGYAILKEEVDELWDEIKKNPKNRDKAALRREAVQVAAMALRFLNDLT